LKDVFDANQLQQALFVISINFVTFENEPGFGIDYQFANGHYCGCGAHRWEVFCSAASHWFFLRKC